MDATSESTSTAAPGIEDNGSGCAALLQMARVFARACTYYTKHTTPEIPGKPFVLAPE